MEAAGIALDKAPILCLESTTFVQKKSHSASRNSSSGNDLAVRLKVKFVRSWSALAGLIHLLAALLLVVPGLAPGGSLALVPVAPGTPADLTAVLAWIFAVLVGGMGVSYLGAVVGSGRTGRLVWTVTAVLHGLVAVFLIWRIDLEELPASWLPKVLPGLVMALVQMAAVRADWWSGVRKWPLYRGGGTARMAV